MHWQPYAMFTTKLPMDVEWVFSSAYIVDGDK